MSHHSVQRGSLLVLAASLSLATPVPTASAEDSEEPACTLTVGTAKEKPHGFATNVWGSAQGCPEGDLTIEANHDGDWHHVTSATSSGDEQFLLPLEGITDLPGEYLVRARIDEFVSDASTFTRHDELAFGHVASKIVGLGTNVWGSVGAPKRQKVWTEVQVNGRWVVSRVAESNDEGAFLIPLSYGQDTAGEHAHRVNTQHADGTVSRGDSFSVRRIALPTTGTAGRKYVGLGTNVWGTIDAGANTKVWTEVLVGGRWAVSRIGQADQSGNYLLPLTYGQDHPGVHTHRVSAQYPDGSVARSKPFDLHRVARPSITTAGSKTIGVNTNAWGTFSDAAGLTVWTEYQHADGTWRRESSGRTSEGGRYVLPLSHGRDSLGATRWRIAGVDLDGSTVRSPDTTLVRTDFDFSRCERVSRAEWGLRTNARNLMRALCHEYPDVNGFIGVQSRSYASYHPSGQAIDIMIFGPRGWEIAHMLQRHHARLGITELIYERRIWTRQRAGEGWRWMASRGNATADHYDHIHVSVPG